MTESIAITLEEIFDKVQESILVSDINGQVLMANSTAAKLIGIRLEEVIGANVLDLVSAGHYHRSNAWEATQSGRVVTGFIRTRAGIDIMSTSTPILDETGNMKAVVTVSREKHLVDDFLEALAREKKIARRYQQEAEYFRDQTLDREQFVFSSKIMRQVIENARIAAEFDSTILICGETGTGKELMAKFIHRSSDRANEPFIAVNCAAIPENLLESELFGYEKGAFSGANAQGKKGLVEIADRGTLFLDEIGELPPALQTKLLRFLETLEFRRVGGTEAKKVDIRLIAATNRDLQQMVDEERFREDLYYRIHVVPIRLPALRERPEDIPMLIEKYLNEFNRKFGTRKKLAPQVMQKAIEYPWPGNVRELKNVFERMVITSKEDVITSDDVSVARRLDKNSVVVNGTDYYEMCSLKEKTDEAEAAHIKHILGKTGGRIGEAAKILRVHRSILWRKIKKHDLRCEIVWNERL